MAFLKALLTCKEIILPRVLIWEPSNNVTLKELGLSHDPIFHMLINFVDGFSDQTKDIFANHLTTV